MTRFVSAVVLALLSTFAVSAQSPEVQQEIAFWQSITTSTNPAEFAAYLEQFPNGVFRTLAQNRLQELRAQADQPNAADADTNAAEEHANRNFLGISFGVAFGMTTDIGSGDRVDGAELVNGVVRVTKAANHRPRILLETHYFWRVDAENTVVSFGGAEVPVRTADIGFGPFAAIQGSDDELLEAFAIGGMVGFKRSERSSFNIGIGVALDPNVKVLGDGLTPNEPLPAGETTVRFKEEARWGVLTLVSFTF